MKLPISIFLHLELKQTVDVGKGTLYYFVCLLLVEAGDGRQHLLEFLEDLGIKFCVQPKVHLSP